MGREKLVELLRKTGYVILFALVWKGLMWTSFWETFSVLEAVVVLYMIASEIARELTWLKKALVFLLLVIGVIIALVIARFFFGESFQLFPNEAWNAWQKGGGFSSIFWGGRADSRVKWELFFWIAALFTLWGVYKKKGFSKLLLKCFVLVVFLSMFFPIWSAIWPQEKEAMDKTITRKTARYFGVAVPANAAAATEGGPLEDIPEPLYPASMAYCGRNGAPLWDGHNYGTAESPVYILPTNCWGTVILPPSKTGNWCWRDPNEKPHKPQWKVALKWGGDPPILLTKWYGPNDVADIGPAPSLTFAIQGGVGLINFYQGYMNSGVCSQMP